MCFPPETIENGNIVNLKQGMYPVDSFVNYECRPGYVALYGEKTRQCLASTEWSGVPPTCVEIMCPYLSRPTNCDLIQTGSGYNSIAEYTCHFGYRFASNITLALNGLFRRRCNESALWDFYEPTCERKIVYFLNLNASFFLLNYQSTKLNYKVVKCPELSNNTFSNGYLRFNCLTYGCEAHYFCTPGSEIIIGDSVRVCKISGKWSGDEAFCKEKGT
jgi:hypothetical protein